MTPADIHAWVRTRWVELLDTARAGGTRGMNWTATGNGEVWHDGAPRFDPMDEGPIVEPGGYPTEAEADHIAAFDPALTIAMCEAALERLDRHAPCYRNSSDEAWQRQPVCDPDGGCRAPWPCPEFLSDASPFRTRPDYPEELRRDG